MPYVVLIDDGRSDKNDCDTGAKFTISHNQIGLLRLVSYLFPFTNSNCIFHCPA